MFVASSSRSWKDLLITNRDSGFEIVGVSVTRRRAETFFSGAWKGEEASWWESSGRESRFLPTTPRADPQLLLRKVVSNGQWYLGQAHMTRRAARTWAREGPWSFGFSQRTCGELDTPHFLAHTPPLSRFPTHRQPDKLSLGPVGTKSAWRRVRGLEFRGPSSDTITGLRVYGRCRRLQQNPNPLPSGFVDGSDHH